MRKRLNRVAVISSSNYSSSRRAHINYLTEQHNNNSVTLMAISSTPVVIDDLQETGMKTTKDFKQEHLTKEYAKLKGLLKGKISK